MQETAERVAETRARERARYLTGLVWHAGSFLIINGFLWLIDWLTGPPGVTWAYWITGVWGFALAFHTLAYVVEGRQIEERKAKEYLHS